MNLNTLSKNLFCILIFAAFSCKKNNNVNSVQNHDIYIVGNDGNQPVYWKNGVEIPLTTTYSFGKFVSGTTTWLTFSGNDLYISGSGYHDSGITTAVYWKNGQLDTLQSLTEYFGESYRATTTANSITFLGNDMYVGGQQSSIFTGIQQGAILWKNGIPTSFGDSYSDIYMLFAANGDLYSVGTSPNYQSSYYKNGTLISLGKELAASSSDGICVSGNDVYVSGNASMNNNNYAAYWKNGVGQILSSNNSIANAITVFGNDVYVGGADEVNGTSVATIWKNGIPTHLPYQGRGSTCNDIHVLDNEIYTVGAMYNSQNYPVATMWKNGIATTLSASRSEAFTMYIK